MYCFLSFSLTSVLHCQATFMLLEKQWVCNKQSTGEAGRGCICTACICCGMVASFLQVSTGVNLDVNSLPNVTLCPSYLDALANPVFLQCAFPMLAVLLSPFRCCLNTFCMIVSTWKYINLWLRPTLIGNRGKGRCSALCSEHKQQQN